MIYIRLFHGRTDSAQQMDDWGTDGPIFGPYKYLHTTYGHHLKMGKSGNDTHELFVVEDMLYYNGVYYGDWSIFDKEILESEPFTLEKFDQSKANLPVN